MKIEIDLHKMMENDLGADEVIYAYLVSVGNEFMIERLFPSEVYRANVKDTLFTGGWITESGKSVTSKYNSIFTELTGLATVMLRPPSGISWIDEWIDLWPKGVRSGGYLVRSDKKSCEKKMNKFLKEHSKVTKEQIFEATKIYVERLRRANWSYMMLATYFIDKEERGSTLAMEIDNLRNKTQGSVKVETTI